MGMYHQPRQYDLVFIPGGIGTRKIKEDIEFVDWIRTAESVRIVTTHANVYDSLEPYCKEVIKTRTVKDGNVITAGGVATSIDLGLYLIELFAGQEEANIVKKQIDYPYTAVGIIEA
ncbi:hypothetical protein [Paenibacillus amylolyticus]|uniref:hypothetical protein n=1 Tax=Paenibacillus amylolyticus TaxID=1451 RepID=UPI003EBB2EB6